MPAKQPVGSSKGRTSTRKLPAAGPAAGEQEQEQEQTQSLGGQSRADLFRNAPKAEGFDFPVGQYVGILTDCVVLTDGQKESVQFKVEVDDGGEQDGKTVSMFYNFFDENGTQMRGMEFFKKDIETLEEEVDSFIEAYSDSPAAFEDRLRVLAEERKRVVIEVKKKGQYTNVYLQGLSQD